MRYIPKGLGKATHPLNKTKIKEYFPVKQTLHGIFCILGELFGIVFRKVDGQFWHADVELYAVWDDEKSGGLFSGYIFIDLYKRPGKIEGCN
jgi:Zn-dependent oligopeptidase